MIETDISRSAAYNALPDVVDADNALTAAGRDDVLRCLSEILVRHGLQDDIGIRLLHRHNDIAADEIMIEQEEREGTDEFRLVTAAGRIPGAQDALFANSWSLSGADAVALEYSMDDVVGSKAARLYGTPDFVGEFKNALDERGLADLLGLCVLDRSFYARRKPLDTGPVHLIETSDVNRRANILQFRAYDGDHRFIETAWKATEFLAKEVRMGCEKTPKCFPTAVIHCDDSPDGHVRTTKEGHDVGSEHIGSPL